MVSNVRITTPSSSKVKPSEKNDHLTLEDEGTTILQNMNTHPRRLHSPPDNSKIPSKTALTVDVLSGKMPTLHHPITITVSIVTKLNCIP